MKCCAHCKGKGFIFNNKATGLPCTCPVCHGTGGFSTTGHQALVEAYKGALSWNSGIVTVDTLRNKSIEYKWGVIYFRYAQLACSEKFDYTGPEFYDRPFIKSNRWQDASLSVKALLSRVRSLV